MKVSYNWLQEYFEEPLPPIEELGEILTFHCYEVEGVEKVGDDHVIDIDILPNRSSDSLSHRGVARELATVLNRKMAHDPLRGDALLVDESEDLSVEIDDMNLCDRYSATVIKGVTIGPSPDWLKVRLEAVGQRSINNVVDATNYVMQNTGQPLHAFDFQKLDGEKKKIRIRNAKQGEKVTTLTGDEYELDEKTLLIVDGNSDVPIALGGVKGGKVAEVDDNTVDIVLEAAHFDYLNVRKTSQRLKLWTDASTRFQNNPSQYLVGYGMADVVELILDIAGGEVEGAIDIKKEESDKNPVHVSITQINRLLGTTLTSEDVNVIFNRFDFDYENEGETFTVTPPFERTDLQIYEDLVEEVGRVHGYEHLEAKRLPENSVSPEIHKGFYYADRIRNILVEAGFSEIYGYTFRDKGDYEAINALASDKSFIRTNLSDGMREYVSLNERNAPLFGLDRVRLFEIGTVFPKKGEYTSLALGISGKKTEKLLLEAKVLLEDKLDTNIIENPKEGVLEINLSALIEGLTDVNAYDSFEKNFTQYQPFSLYPFMLRDISLWVPSTVSEESVSKIINEKAGELLIRKTLFDQFEKDGRISYAYHLVFQSDDRTLTDEEINKIMDQMTEFLNSQKGFEVR